MELLGNSQSPLTAQLGYEQIFQTLDLLLEGVQILDFEWRYLYVNDTATKHCQASRLDLVGFTIMEKFPGIEASKYFEDLSICMLQRKSQQLEYNFIFQNKTTRWFSFRIEPLEEGVLILSLDISDEKTQKASASLKANKELGLQNEEKEKRAYELEIVNKELVFQNNEKEARAGELAVANKELAFQNSEKEKRANELVVANNELIFQNEEKEARANELIIANKELAFQNSEKEKRANEHEIANKELIFQNKEKEARAGELIIANQELAFQNTEKEKRATELAIANKELTYQNSEKEERAKELIIANKELAFQNEEKGKRAMELMASNVELQLAEERLLKINLELEAFSYSVSHDLRAPLRAILGYSRMLKVENENHLNAEGNRFIENIMGNAKKMSRLIDDLLTFSRLGRKDLVKTHINMHDMVVNIVSELKREVEDRNIEFKMDALLPAFADRITLRQVWLNLISNAIKYTKPKEHAIIEIASKLTGNEIIYSIKDNGAGFDKRYAAKLFGVFQRLHSEEEFEGTGVGLAIVQRIISKHEGRVWGEGIVNKGATFYFTLNK